MTRCWKRLSCFLRKMSPLEVSNLDGEDLVSMWVLCCVVCMCVYYVGVWVSVFGCPCLCVCGLRECEFRQKSLKCPAKSEIPFDWVLLNEPYCIPTLIRTPSHVNAFISFLSLAMASILADLSYTHTWETLTFKTEFSFFFNISKSKNLIFVHFRCLKHDFQALYAVFSFFP